MNALRRILASGAVAALAMDVAQAAYAAAFERGREPDDLDEETEAVASVVARLAKLAPGSFAQRYPETTGRFVHYFFGSLFAVVYASARRRAPRIATGNGLVFGTALWVVSDVVLVPAAHFGRPLGAYSRAEQLNALVSHLVYAVTLDRLLDAWT